MRRYVQLGLLILGISLNLLNQLHADTHGRIPYKFKQGTNPNNDRGGWEKIYGGAEEDVFNDILELQEGGFIMVGHTFSIGNGHADIYVVRIDAQGNQMWFKTYGGNGGDSGIGIEKTDDGDFIILGETTSAWGASGTQVYVIRIDASGDQKWAKTYGDKDGLISPRAISSATVDKGLERFIITGQVFVGHDRQAFLLKIDSLGNQEWMKTYGKVDEVESAEDVLQTSDRGYMFIGGTSTPGNLEDQVYLTKTNSDGVVEWTKFYGEEGSDYGYSIAAATDGGYILGGGKAVGDDGSNAWLIKIDVNGNVEWEQQYDMDIIEWVSSVIQTLPDEGYIFTGSTGYRDGQIFMSKLHTVKTDKIGNMEWTTLKGYPFAWGEEIQQTVNGNYIVAGFNYGYRSGKDAYVSYLDPLTGEVSAPAQVR